MAGSSGARDVNRTRTQIAFVIVSLGLVGVVVVSWVALHYATAKDEISRLVFASVLPLIGTWVGAVLAFYFSRDNLQAASQTALDAVRVAGGLQSETPVTSVMIRVDRMVPVAEVADDAAAQALLLRSLHEKMQATGNSRVPVLSAGVARYVVHEPDIDRYAQQQGMQVTALPDTATLAALLQDPGVAAEVTGFVAVGPATTVGEARAALSRNPHAKDVFVTDNGATDGKVLGWLTNTDLARVA